MKLYLTTSAFVFVLACGKSDTRDKPAESAKPTEQAAVELQLPTLGLTATVPAHTEAQAFGDKVRLHGAGVGVDIGPGDAAQTPEALQQSQSTLGGADFQKAQLADGWSLRWKGKAGEQLITAQRQINGKAISCQANHTTSEQIDAALAVCNSLKPKL